MTTSLVRPFAVISGAQVHRALGRREKQIVMVALGSQVHVTAEPDPVDGFLTADRRSRASSRGGMCCSSAQAPPGP
jgi:hypothetical protein